MKHALSIALLVTASVCQGPAHAADQAFKPFVLASSGPGDLSAVTAEVIGNLESAGFELAGQYAPMEDTRVIVVTDGALKTAAAMTGRGAYGAAQRVSVSRTDDGIEVGFVNPVYIQHAYRMDADLAPIRDRLTEALGFEAFCGADGKKMTAKKLSDYNYMIGMQQFDDPSELGKFDSHEAAIDAVTRGLDRAGDGLTRIYRIDIPGQQQVLFGVGMRQAGDEDEHIDEAYQMGIVDFEGCRKSAYLPYEILVDGSRVEALHMRFRMAVHFPNLSMMGKHGFTKLMPFPGAIEDALENAVNTP